MEKMKIKGYIKSWLSEDAESCTINLEYNDYEKEKEVYIYDLMNGEDFINNVQSGGFIDYDGGIGEILLDGYETNIGMDIAGIYQHGELLNGDKPLMLDEYGWEKLLKEYDVKVNWINK